MIYSINWFPAYGRQVCPEDRGDDVWIPAQKITGMTKGEDHGNDRSWNLRQ